MVSSLVELKCVAQQVIEYCLHNLVLIEVCCIKNKEQLIKHKEDLKLEKKASLTLIALRHCQNAIFSSFQLGSLVGMLLVVWK
jgi:flavin reductase (DIM6/NTAB) family NADH-FMN oxidoreductase RutF